MSTILLDITQGTGSLVPFALASLGILVVGAIVVILLLKLLKRLSK